MTLKVTKVDMDNAFTNAVVEVLKGDHNDLRKEAIILRLHRDAIAAAEARGYATAKAQAAGVAALGKRVISYMIKDERKPGNAPGHSHEIQGIWENDNGEKSGTACEWCKTWNEFRTAIEAMEPTDEHD